MYPKPTIDCQACGVVIEDNLDQATIDKLLENPYNFVRFCYLHKEEGRYFDRI